MEVFVGLERFAAMSFIIFFFGGLGIASSFGLCIWVAQKFWKDEYEDGIIGH